MGKRKPPPPEVPLAEAAQKLRALVKKLPDAPDGKIALTVRGEVRAWLVAHVEPAEDDEPTRKVRKLVKQALKAARE